MDRHETSDRLARSRDHDLLTRGHSIQEPGELGLGLVDVEGLHLDIMDLVLDLVYTVMVP